MAITLFFLAYSPALDGPFVFDDQKQITDNILVTNGEGLAKLSFWTNINERPIAAFTLFLNYQLTGSEAFWFRVTNMFLHLINAFMVFLIAKELSAFEKKESDEHLACGLGLLFLLHPLLSENFLYVSQRGTSLSALFYFLSLLFYLKSKRTTAKHILVSAFFFILALYSKQTAFSLIMVVALLELFVLPESSNSRRAFIVSLLVCGALFLLYEYGGYTGKTYADLSSIDYLLLQVSFMWKYLFLMVLPYPLILDYDVPAVLNIAWLGVGVLLLIVSLVLFIRSNSIVLRSGLVLYFFGNLVVLTIIPLPDLFVEHRMYIPFLGVGLVLAHVLSKFRYANYAWIAFIVLLLPLGFLRAQSWQTKVTLFEHNAKHAPMNDRVWANLGEAYLNEGESSKALEPTLTALSLDSSNYVALNNLGLIYLLEDRPMDAVETLKKSLSYYGRNYRAWNNIGVAYMRLKKSRKAMKAFSNSVRVMPGQFDAYYNIALLAEQNQRPRDALKAYRKCISLYPQEWKAHHNLAILMLKVGKFKETKAFLSQRVFQAEYEYWNDLGATHLNLAEFDLARNCFEKSLSIKPSNEVAVQNIERTVIP